MSNETESDTMALFCSSTWLLDEMPPTIEQALMGVKIKLLALRSLVRWSSFWRAIRLENFGHDAGTALNHQGALLFDEEALGCSHFHVIGRRAGSSP
jgi:hypothetical protein